MKKKTKYNPLIHVKDGDVLSAKKYNALIDIVLKNQQDIEWIIEHLKRKKITSSIQEIEL